MSCARYNISSYSPSWSSIIIHYWMIAMVIMSCDVVKWSCDSHVRWNQSRPGRTSEVSLGRWRDHTSPGPGLWTWEPGNGEWTHLRDHRSGGERERERERERNVKSFPSWFLFIFAFTVVNIEGILYEWKLVSQFCYFYGFLFPNLWPCMHAQCLSERVKVKVLLCRVGPRQWGEALWCSWPVPSPPCPPPGPSAGPSGLQYARDYKSILTMFKRIQKVYKRLPW